jgi:shikimate dehydrogenase
MQHYGLLGRSLQHSFSKSYFQKKFEDLGLHDFAYHNFELENLSGLAQVLNTKNLRGLNVTIPYKEEILPYLHSLDPIAAQVGAVNCIRIEDGQTRGYNTDVYGFSQSIKPFLDVNHERALLLGTGGAARAVSYALKTIGVQTFFVSSTRDKKNSNVFLYEDLNRHIFDAFHLIINTTPVGTFPSVSACPPLPYEFITPRHFVYDLIYNPSETRLLEQSRQQGATVMNRLSMLQLQAEKSWEIWQENVAE